MATPSNLAERLTALREKLDELVERRSPEKLLPPYTDAELAAVEERLGIGLPDEQRAFLLTVTQGESEGFGPPMYPPDQGLLCLGPGDAPSAAFAFGDAEAAAFLGAIDEHHPRASALLQAPMNGLLPIMDHGDGEYDCVVLTGEQRGQMWNWSEAGLAPLFDLAEGRARPLDFLAWVEREIEVMVRAAPPRIDAEVKDIQLGSQGLTEVPEEVFSARSAEKLDLCGNQLAVLPDRLSGLRALRTLNVGSNRLSRLPDSLGDLGLLQNLYASMNALRELPDSLGRLTALERLLLSSNHLLRLPETIAGLTSLLELDVESNQLSELPEGIGAMCLLQTLKIANNPLERLPEGLAGTSLKALRLDGLPALDLDQALGVAARIPSLTSLEIANTRRPLPPLGAFRKLEALSLVGLGLPALPADILRLPSLESLSFSRNLVTSLPDELFALPRLKYVSLYSNPVDKAYLDSLRARFPQVAIRT